MILEFLATYAVFLAIIHLSGCGGRSVVFCGKVSLGYMIGVWVGGVLVVADVGGLYVPLCVTSTKSHDACRSLSAETTVNRAPP